MEFLVRFDELVEKLRRTTTVDEATAKATLLFAIEDSFPTVYFREVTVAGSGMSVEDLKMTIINEEKRLQEAA